MSLLLDALNRASKDRAAADAAAPSPRATGWPNIALQILPNPPPVEHAAPPPEPPPEAASPEAAPVLTLAAAEPAASGLRLEPMFMEPPAQAAVAADQPPSMNPVAPASPTPTPTPVSPAPAAKPAEPLKVAQNIMRAKQGTLAVRPSRQRLLALGGVAGLLGLGGTMLWLGWLGPLALPGQPASPVPLASTPLVVNPASTVAPATTVATMVGSTEPPASAVAAASDPLAAMPAKPKTAARPVPAVAKAGRRAAVGLTTDTAPSTAEVATPTARPAARARAAASAAKPTELPNLLAMTPNGASPLELAYAALMQGRLADAEAGYKQVLKSSPEERDALLGLAYIAHQEGRGEGARDFYKQVLRQEPGNPTARAGLLMQSLSSQTEDASVGARNLAEQHPAAAAAQSVLGHSLVRQGRLADAQMAFQRAHVLEPSVALHAFNLAVAFDRLKNYAAASRLYERALSLSTQGGGAAASGLVHAVVQKRLQELGLVGSPNPPATN
ncbi:hypothetical protein LBMAG30_16430 [Comamonadaceae bacterium]|nr:hypothetical protein LBMAG30_16430 [Comamonadaceae bacterium]